MTKYKRLKRIMELQEKIQGIVHRAKHDKKRNKLVVNKQTAKSLKQYEKAIAKHKAILIEEGVEL